MAIVSIKFGCNEDFLELHWLTLDTPIANKWIRSLSAAIPYGIFENDRIYNFPGQPWTKEKIVRDLTACMKEIEGFYPGIFPFKPFDGMELTQTNDLHVCFEHLRGAVDAPSEMFINAPKHIQNEINRYNILIHRYESQILGNGKIKRPRIVCSFINEHRKPLGDDDYDYFSMDYGYGDMSINYPQVGKTFLEVFHDNDDVVTDAGIRPMKYYAAGFKVVFSEFSKEDASMLRADFNQWFDRKENYFNSLGFHKNDKKIALGHLTVAKLMDTGLDRSFINSEIGRLNIIKEVKIIQL